MVKKGRRSVEEVIGRALEEKKSLILLFKIETIILYYVTEDRLKLLISLDSAFDMEMYNSSMLGTKELLNQIQSCQKHHVTVQYDNNLVANSFHSEYIT